MARHANLCRLMTVVPSISQVNSLGRRLGKGCASADDIELLTAYQSAFEPALNRAMELVRSVTSRELASRPEKSVRSIIRKIRRDGTRLSKMQDLAGCRVVVDTVEEQDEVVRRILTTPGDWSLIDRRDEPIHGYRAVHLIYKEGRWQVEVQIRTVLQHLWANLSEAWDREVQEEIKYGEGPPEVLRPLGLLSTGIARLEARPASREERDAIRDQITTALSHLAGRIAPSDVQPSTGGE
jgi:putative GTP pyrophosphokinase